MKEETIVKINKIGKAGDIVARILRILLIIAFVVVLGALITLSVLPANLVEVDLGMQTGIKVNVSNFAELSEEEQAEVRKGFEEFNNDKDEDATISDVEVTSSTIAFKVGTDKKSFGLRDLIGPVIVALFYIVGSYVILWFVSMLCRALRDCNSPFEDDVIRRMRNFAFAILAWCVLAVICNIVISSIFISATQINVGFSLGHVLLVLVILGLCGIFRYGAKLQKEHDETL